MEIFSKNNSLTSGDWKPPKFTSLSKKKKLISPVEQASLVD
jgi:hypothetical protein